MSNLMEAKQKEIVGFRVFFFPSFGKLLSLFAQKQPKLLSSRLDMTTDELYSQDGDGEKP